MLETWAAGQNTGRRVKVSGLQLLSVYRCAEKPPLTFCSTWMLPCSAVAPAWTDIPAAAQLLPRTPKNSDLGHAALTAA